MYDELPLWSAPFGLKLLDYIDYKPNIIALDLGFGTGFPLIELAMRLGNNSTVYGIDILEDAFVKVEEKINNYDIKNIKLIKGSVEAIPLENNSVHLITSNNCINNVQDTNKALNECSRILNKNGQLILTMNLEKSMFEFYDIIEKTLLELKLKTVVKLMYKHIEQKRPPIDRIITPMKQNFLVKDIVYDQFYYKFTNGTAMLNHNFIKVAFLESWKKIFPKDKIKEIFEIIEDKLNILSERLSGLKLSIPFVLISGIKK
jgi:ubiquinone/menaquinone biosynthesis C-methylase UbiE